MTVTALNDACLVRTMRPQKPCASVLPDPSIKIVTPAAETRALIEEIIWWHAAMRDYQHSAPVTYAQVMSDSCERRVAKVRDDCIIRIRDKRRWSTLRLGQLFNRDCTSILAALDRERSRKRSAANYRRRVSHNQPTIGGSIGQEIPDQA